MKHDAPALRLTLLSDTHGLHNHLPPLPEGDILIHAGDVSNRGLAHEVHDFLHWFATQPHPHKIFIAGNHDFFFEQAPAEAIAAAIPPGVHYLNDSAVTMKASASGAPPSPRASSTGPSTATAGQTSRGTTLECPTTLTSSSLTARRTAFWIS